MKKLRKLITIALAVVITLTFAACGASFKFDKDAAVTQAKKIVEVANTRDYQAVVDMLPESMQSSVPADDLKASWDPMLTESGAFVDYNSVQASGVTQNGVDYIVVIASCKYANNTRIFTISFTTDMVVAGLYMK